MINASVNFIIYCSLSSGFKKIIHGILSSYFIEAGSTTNCANQEDEIGAAEQRTQRIPNTPTPNSVAHSGPAQELTGLYNPSVRPSYLPPATSNFNFATPTEEEESTDLDPSLLTQRSTEPQVCMELVRHSVSNHTLKRSISEPSLYHQSSSGISSSESKGFSCTCINRRSRKIRRKSILSDTFIYASNCELYHKISSSDASASTIPPNKKSVAVLQKRNSLPNLYIIKILFVFGRKLSRNKSNVV